MTELKLICLIWKYSLPAAVLCAMFSPSKVGLPTVIVTGATVSTVVLAPKSKNLNERVEKLEQALIKTDSY